MQLTKAQRKYRRMCLRKMLADGRIDKQTFAESMKALTEATCQ